MIIWSETRMFSSKYISYDPKHGWIGQVRLGYDVRLG